MAGEKSGYKKHPGCLSILANVSGILMTPGTVPELFIAPATAPPGAYRGDPHISEGQPKGVGHQSGWMLNQANLQSQFN